MVVKPERAGPRKSRMVGHQRARWIGFPATATLAPVVIASVFGVLYLGRVITATPQGTAVAMIGLAGLSGIAAVANRRTNVALAGRVDLLNRAFEAAPHAQLIVDPNGERSSAKCGVRPAFSRRHRVAAVRSDRASPMPGWRSRGGIEATSPTSSSRGPSGCDARIEKGTERSFGPLQDISRPDRRAHRIQFLDIRGHHCT